MAQLQIETADQQRRFAPGATLDGAVFWEFDVPPKHLDVNLFWFTRGKGTEDVEIVDSLRVDQPPAAGQQPFRFTLPAAPFSFSGTLVSIVWALEVLAEPGEHAARLEFSLSPYDEEIVLKEVPKDGRRLRNARAQ